MKDDKGVMKSPGKENQLVTENGKKKTKEERPATKIVVRRLPPSMTEEQFKMQVSPFPEIDYFYFVPADMTLMPNAFSRAYINFVDQSDLFIFTEKFDGYVFVDSKGGEFPAVVEFAPFQRIPKNRPNRKKDPKVGTIESDPTYIKFKEYLEAVSLENRTSANVSKQHFFETSLENERKEVNNTPLLDYIKNKRVERQRIREEKREEKRKRDLERKRAKDEQKRSKKEDDTSVLKPIPSSSDHPSSSNQPSTESRNNEPKLNNLYLQNYQIKDKIEDSNLPCALSADLNDSHGDLEVSKKVRNMVQLFDKILTGSSGIKNNTDSVVKCEKHKDIETEIIKSAWECNTESVHNSRVLVSSYKPLKQFCESNNVHPSHKQIPLEGVRSRVFVPRSNKASQYTILRSTMENSQKKESKTSKVVEIKNGSKTVFPVEILKKKREKVVSDVLGNSSVQNTNKSISKPKTLTKRVLIGSGEQWTRPGFNTLHYCLSPRHFRRGPTQYNRREPDTDSREFSCRPTRSLPQKDNLPKLRTKSTSSLSKVMIYSSISQGYIESTECKR